MVDFERAGGDFRVGEGWGSWVRRGKILLNLRLRLYIDQYNGLWCRGADPWGVSVHLSLIINNTGVHPVMGQIDLSVICWSLTKWWRTYSVDVMICDI